LGLTDPAVCVSGAAAAVFRGWVFMLPGAAGLLAWCRCRGVLACAGAEQ
jgi:hypothetical protein